ncbi:MAG: hypothetical protein P4L22_04195 [Candidatus Babeliales bacterium]|nr:hypothetical protein [Candidatus Babeliales bacterium]
MRLFKAVFFIIILANAEIIFATCGAPGVTCNQDSDCCGYCDTSASAAAGDIYLTGTCKGQAQCPGNLIMGSNGKCVCPPNQTLQPGGQMCCLANQVLVNGKCVCPGNQQIGLDGKTCVCDTTKQYLASDGKTCCAFNQTFNNGVCNNCPAGQLSVNNVCVNNTCQSGYIAAVNQNAPQRIVCSPPPVKFCPDDTLLPNNIYTNLIPPISDPTYNMCLSSCSALGQSGATYLKTCVAKCPTGTIPYSLTDGSTGSDCYFQNSIEGSCGCMTIVPNASGCSKGTYFFDGYPATGTPVDFGKKSTVFGDIVNQNGKSAGICVPSCPLGTVVSANGNSCVAATCPADYSLAQSGPVPWLHGSDNNMPYDSSDITTGGLKCYKIPPDPGGFDLSGVVSFFSDAFDDLCAQKNVAGTICKIDKNGLNVGADLLNFGNDAYQMGVAFANDINNCHGDTLTQFEEVVGASSNNTDFNVNFASTGVNITTDQSGTKNSIATTVLNDPGTIPDGQSLGKYVPPSPMSGTFNFTNNTKDTITINSINTGNLTGCTFNLPLKIAAGKSASLGYSSCSIGTSGWLTYTSGTGSGAVNFTNLTAGGCSSIWQATGTQDIYNSGYQISHGQNVMGSVTTNLLGSGLGATTLNVLSQMGQVINTVLTTGLGIKVPCPDARYNLCNDCSAPNVCTSFGMCSDGSPPICKVQPATKCSDGSKPPCKDSGSKITDFTNCPAKDKTFPDCGSADNPCIYPPCADGSNPTIDAKGRPICKGYGYCQDANSSAPVCKGADPNDPWEMYEINSIAPCFDGKDHTCADKSKPACIDNKYELTAAAPWGAIHQFVGPIFQEFDKSCCDGYLGMSIDVILGVVGPGWAPFVNPLDPDPPAEGSTSGLVTINTAEGPQQVNVVTSAFNNIDYICKNNGKELPTTNVLTGTLKIEITDKDSSKPSVSFTTQPFAFYYGDNLEVHVDPTNAGVSIYRADAATNNQLYLVNCGSNVLPGYTTEINCGCNVNGKPGQINSAGSDCTGVADTTLVQGPQVSIAGPQK